MQNVAKISFQATSVLQCVLSLLTGLDPSGYRSSIAHKDENDALLGGEAQMSDEERFKVVI